MLRNLVLCLSLAYFMQIGTTSFNLNSLTQREPRLLNGSIISIYNARYIVSVRLKALESTKGYGYGHICTGAVISQRAILTAGSCLTNLNHSSLPNYTANDFTLVMGSPYLYQRDIYTLQYDVQEVVIYPQFIYPNSALDDIAVMFIDGYIPWNWPTVAAIALNEHDVLANVECFVTGWGNPPSNIKNISGVLQQVKVPIMNDEYCKNEYYDFTAAMLCAGFNNYSGIDVCGGDIGAPLACNGLLTGVAAWFNSCLNGPYVSGFYGNVSYFDNWILTTNATFNYTLYKNFGFRLIQTYSLIISCIILICINYFRSYLH